MPIHKGIEISIELTILDAERLVSRIVFGIFNMRIISVAPTSKLLDIRSIISSLSGSYTRMKRILSG